MCGDSFSFFLFSGFFGALMLDARFRLVPPSVGLDFFGGGSGVLKSRTLFLVVDITRCKNKGIVFPLTSGVCYLVVWKI
jgi:hypothetical protein